MPNKARRYTELVGRDSFSVQLPDFIRTTTFRWTPGVFALCIVLFSAFVYWEAADYLLAKTDAALTENASRLPETYRIISWTPSMID